MSKLKDGDQVRVVSVTDVDEEIGSPKRVVTDPTNKDTFDWTDTGRSFIGQIGRVMSATLNDYYDVEVWFEWMDVYEAACFKYPDVELVERPDAPLGVSETREAIERLSK